MDEHWIVTRRKLESLSNGELFDLALKEYAGDDSDDFEFPSPVSELWRRGTTEIFVRARELCSSDIAAARELGIAVLAQLGIGEPDSGRPHMDESVEIALRLLGDSDPEVVQAAAWALTHLNTDEAVGSLIGLRTHLDPEVRRAVAYWRGGYEDFMSIATLLELMNDNTDLVRRWATFSLGTLCESDTPEIRSALRIRLTDAVEDVRDEALWGLAKRRDRNALKAVLNRISSDRWSSCDEDAAKDALGRIEACEIEQIRDGLRGLLDESEPNE